MEHSQLGITWTGDGHTQIMCDKDKFYLVLTRNGFTSSRPISKGVAQFLLEGGMGIEG